MAGTASFATALWIAKAKGKEFSIISRFKIMAQTQNKRFVFGIQF